MSQRDKLLERLGDPSHDAATRFDEVCALLVYLGYKPRQKGTSHVSFTLPSGDLPRPLVLVRLKGGLMRPYQVVLVREELQRRSII